MFSHKPTAHCQHTCCQRNCLACLGPSAVQVIVSPCCRLCQHCRIPRRCRIHQCCQIPHVSLCHPGTVSSSLGQSSPKPQLSSARCCASYCVLPHTHAVDFYYCHAGCHPVATVQQCFSSAYTLTDFNPVTPRMKVVKGSEFICWI
jgi:hypothetical protein